MGIRAQLRIFGILAAMVLAVAMLAAACGGDDNGGSTPTTAAGTAPASATAGPSKEVTAEIDQKDLQFVPNKVTIKAGETVLFKSSDTALHTVDIDGKNLSGNMKKGDTFYWTAPKAGSYKVTCDYHPQMTATITVQ